MELVEKMVPMFNGNQSELVRFLKVVKLINDGLTEADKLVLIDFVIDFKLGSAVRTAICLTAIPITFEQLKTELESTYKSTKTANQVSNALNGLQQRRQSVNDFKEKILELVKDLNALQIAELNNPTTEVKVAITELNAKVALKTFKSGVDEYLKQTIYAARPSSLNEAVNLALELETDKPNTVMYFDRQNSNNRFNNNRNFGGRGNFRSNANDNFNRNTYRHTNNNNAYQQNYRQGYNNNNNRNQNNRRGAYHNNRGNNRNNFNSGQRNYVSDRNNHNNRNNNNNNWNRNPTRQVRVVSDEASHTQNQGNSNGSGYENAPNSRN